MTIFSAHSGSFQVWKHNFVIDRGGTYLKQVIKGCWLRFKCDLIIYCSIENVGHRELLPGNFWAFFRNSNYARQQALKSGSSDWSFWKCSCERKLLQTLVKICLKVIFCSKVVTLHYAKLNSFIVCLLGFSDQNGKDLLLHSIWKPEADHITSNFLKAVFHKFYLVHSWKLCPAAKYSKCIWPFWDVRN